MLEIRFRFLLLAFPLLLLLVLLIILFTLFLLDLAGICLIQACEKCGLCAIRSTGRPGWGWQKLELCDFLRHYKSDKLAKFCTEVVLIVLYLLISQLVTLTTFQGDSVINLRRQKFKAVHFGKFLARPVPALVVKYVD